MKDEGVLLTEKQTLVIVDLHSRQKIGIEIARDIRLLEMYSYCW